MSRKYLTDNRASASLFILTFVVYALVYMTKNCYSAAMASIVNEGIMTKSQTGLISAVFYLIYAPFQILGGMAADRYSPSKLVLIGVVGAGIANLLIYFVNSYIAMMIIWSCNAVVQFGVWPAVFKIVTTQVSAQYRLKGMFYITMSPTFGLLISYVCAMFISNWKNNFMFSAITLFVSAIVFFVCYNSIEKKMVSEEVVAKPSRKDEPKAQNVFGLIIKSGIPLLLVVSIIQNMLNLGVKALTPVMIMESYEAVTPALANGLNIILIMAAPLGMFLAEMRVFQRISATSTIAIFLAVSLPLLFVITFIGRIPVFFVIAALALLMVIMAALSIFFSYVSMSFDKFGRTATISGLFNCMASLGIVLANYVFAKLADFMGWGITTNCWFVITLFALLLALIAVPIWKRFTNIIR